jgi:toxin YoeB
MKLVFTKRARLDYLWFREKDNKLFRKINDFIEEIKRTPFTGTGKPEPLKYLSGYWSRRINSQHRLVYTVSEQEVTIISCRFHYQK